jgi:PiT family inorganic phosphate transporter
MLLSIIVILIIIFALGFEFTNGFHDAANAVATIVSTGALKPKVALGMSAVMNLLGATISVGVAKTIATAIVDLKDVQSSTVELEIIFSAILGAVTWNLLTWWWGLPSSSSHAIIGGLAGSGFAASLIKSNGEITIFWEHGIFQKVIQPMLTSPALGFVIAFLLMCLMLNILKNQPYGKVIRRFKKLQILSAAALSVGHGMQDAQKTMGIIFLCTTAAGWTDSDSTIPMYVRILCALSISAGTYAGGFRIIKTMGNKIIKLDSVKGFVAETTTAGLLYLMAALNLPVSVTHTATMSIMGAGATKNANAVKWGMAGNIVRAWIFTLPATAIIGGVGFFVVSFITNLF